MVVVSLGLTTFYFLRNDEVISIGTKEIYCNAGETIPLESLGITRKKAHRKTAFNYNAGGESVTKYVNFDESKGYYIVSNQSAGDVTLVISTTNEKYAEFTVVVHIGDGSEQHPYYIFNESDLEKIGSTYAVDKHFKLMSNITLTANFNPIGYDESTQTALKFNGSFDGNGYTISGLNLVNGDYANAGLFYEIGKDAKVSNLAIDRATISGEYATAGVLAGTIAGEVKNVAITNANITNTQDGGVTGALAGFVNTTTIKTSYANNVNITIGDSATPITSAIAGGFIGRINESTIQATYVNNADIVVNGSASVGGYAGVFTIGTETGSIQQSYANTTSQVAGFGAFINTLDKTPSFDDTKANMLLHLVGNFAIVEGKTSASQIVDADLIKDFDTSYFKNVAYPTNQALFDVNAAQYMVRGFASINEVIDTNEYIFYAIDNSANGIVSWNDEYIWKTSAVALPVLRMGAVDPASISGEYLRKDLEERTIVDADALANISKQDGKIKLLADLDLTSNWSPISLKNYTINGNNKTIRIKLNSHSNNQAGVFSVLDNCSVENLNIIVEGVEVNATNVGALAGTIKSSNANASSSIKNVKVTYTGAFTSTSISRFGGLVAEANSTNISGSSIEGLVMSGSVNAGTVGGLVAVYASGIASANRVQATIYGTQSVGGLVGTNGATISNSTIKVTINYNQSVVAALGGVAGVNSGSIINNSVELKMNITNAGEELVAGGVVGRNIANSEIKGTTIYGDGISVASVDGKIIIGGIAGKNEGTITLSSNKMDKVGDFVAGKNMYVAGIAAINNGIISQCLATSGVYGNYAAGVVVEMKTNASAKIDQVAVGQYNEATKKLSQNAVVGDKYVAGIAVDFRVGEISNVQVSSRINGKTNTTRASLAVLVFPYGATLRNVTIDSTITGYGKNYKLTWTDFASYDNKPEFGFSAGIQTEDAYFDIYMNDTYHGSMQSVVVNNANSGVADTIDNLAPAFLWNSYYTNSAESSFYKSVDGFKDIGQFQGTFTFNYAKSTVFGIIHSTEKTLTFGIGDVWEANKGISLIFLNNI